MRSTEHADQRVIYGDGHGKRTEYLEPEDVRLIIETGYTVSIGEHLELFYSEDDGFCLIAVLLDNGDLKTVMPADRATWFHKLLAERVMVGPEKFFQATNVNYDMYCDRNNLIVDVDCIEDIDAVVRSRAFNERAVELLKTKTKNWRYHAKIEFLTRRDKIPMPLRLPYDFLHQPYPQ